VVTEKLRKDLVYCLREGHRPMVIFDQIRREKNELTQKNSTAPLPHYNIL
jgi:hypothetical protein